MQEAAANLITPEVDEAIRFFGIKIINWSDFIELLIRFTFNLLVTTVLGRYLYYAASKRKDYLFTYTLIGATVFLLCFLLESVKIELGFALGLFAIFGIIRYRTDTISIKEMTYLFIIIGLSVINALANKKVSYAELVFTNAAVVALAWGLERWWVMNLLLNKKVVYEKIELIKPENYDMLVADIQERTGLDVEHIEVGNINFMRDTAELIVHYYSNKNIEQ